MVEVRKLIVALFILMFSGGFSACEKPETSQSKGENTMVNDHTSWATLAYGVCPECPVWTEYVYFDGDSIFAKKTYKTVYSCDDELHENIKYEGLIREQNKKTYFIPAHSEIEYLLYDFSLEKGMSFEYRNFNLQESMSLYVKNVDFIEINGSTKKRIEIAETRNPEWIIDTWIEEIGSLRGILYPCLQLDGGVRKLLCCFKNNELIYKNHEYSECYYDKSEDVKN